MAHACGEMCVCINVCDYMILHVYIHIDTLPHGTATSDPSWRDSKYIGQFLKVLLYSYIQLYIYRYRFGR